MEFFKKKTRTKNLIGIGLILFAIAGIFFWENYGRAQFLYTDVIVFKEEVQANKIVDIKMLGKIKADNSSLVQGVITNVDDIVGKQTLTIIPQGLQLSPKFFGQPQMSTGDGKYVFAVPDEWIYSCPQTVRRGDQVYFYPVPGKKSEDGGSYDQSGAYITPDAPVSVETTSSAIVSTSVAYVKDSANREIVDVVPVRLDGTAAVAKLEVIVDDTQYKQLKDSYENGFQFVVMYE